MYSTSFSFSKQQTKKKVSTASLPEIVRSDDDETVTVYSVEIENDDDDESVDEDGSDDKDGSDDADEVAEDTLKDITGFKYEKGKLKLQIKTTDHPHKEFLFATEVLYDWPDQAQIYIQYHNLSMEEKKKKQREKNVSKVTKKNATGEKPNTTITKHNLIQVSKDLGLCGVDHSSIENFNEESNPLFFLNNNDLEGVMCHKCGGDFTVENKKPTARKPVYHCIKRCRGCRVVFCNKCYVNKLHTSDTPGRRSRNKQSFTIAV